MDTYGKRKFTRSDCLSLLTAKKRTLEEEGLDRLPRRSDFTDAEVNAIKAFLGPWPRALEAAGIKPPRSDDRRALNAEKRARAKRRRNEQR